MTQTAVLEQFNDPAHPDFQPAYLKVHELCVGLAMWHQLSLLTEEEEWCLEIGAGGELENESFEGILSDVLRDAVARLEQLN